MKLPLTSTAVTETETLGMLKPEIFLRGSTCKKWRTHSSLATTLLQRIMASVAPDVAPDVEPPLKRHKADADAVASASVDVIDLTGDVDEDAKEAPAPAPALQSPLGRAQCLLGWVQSQGMRPLDECLKALFNSDQSAALADLSVYITGLVKQFKDRVAGLSPQPKFKVPEAYKKMPRKAWKALSEAEKLYARSLKLFDETYRELADVRSTLREAHWTQDERRWFVAERLGCWLDKQHERLLKKAERLHGGDVEAFVAGFAKFSAGLEPHRSRAAADALPEWEKLYRRHDQRFKDMHAELTAMLAAQ